MIPGVLVCPLFLFFSLPSIHLLWRAALSSITRGWGDSDKRTDLPATGKNKKTHTRNVNSFCVEAAHVVICFLLFGVVGDHLPSYYGQYVVRTAKYYFRKAVHLQVKGVQISSGGVKTENRNDDYI